LKDVVPSCVLALALAGAPENVQIRGSDLPLVVTSAAYDLDRRTYAFSLRNDGPLGIVAWSVEEVWHYKDGGESRGSVSADAYEQAAGLADAPSGNAVLAPGQSLQQRPRPAPSRDGALPDRVTFGPYAVLLEGNRALGDAGAVERMLLRRRQAADAWQEVLSRLEAARPAARDSTNPLERAKAALEPTRTEENPRGSVTLRLWYRILNAERDGEDPQAVFEGLVQGAREHVEAARRFGTPAADQPADLIRP
jgi:hypothetical protein